VHGCRLAAAATRAACGACACQLLVLPAPPLPGCCSCMLLPCPPPRRRIAGGATHRAAGGSRSQEEQRSIFKGVEPTRFRWCPLRIMADSWSVVAEA
jgi:hypothetical protein